MIKPKVDDALFFIKEQLAGCKNPALAYSGGKDSTVLLYLVRQIMPEIPVAYFSLHEDARKEAWIHEIAGMWDLRLHILQPIARDMAGLGTHVEIIHFFQLGEFAFHLGLQGGKFLSNPICAIEKHLAPVSQDHLDAEMVFVGHKSSDIDTLYGPAPLGQRIAWSEAGHTQLAFPLRDWTDADIWEATTWLNIPQNWRRYDRKTHEKLKSEQFNSDVYNLCTRCVTPGQGAVVQCPKLNGPIDSIANPVLLEQRFQFYKQQFDRLYQ